MESLLWLLLVLPVCSFATLAGNLNVFIKAVTVVVLGKMIFTPCTCSVCNDSACIGNSLESMPQGPVGWDQSICSWIAWRIVLHSLYAGSY